MIYRNRRRLGFGLLLFVITAAVYLATRAPGLTWAHRGADGGDFLAAAAVLGVAHPPGYPTYTLLLHLMMQLPWNEPAAAGNVLSSLAGAAAVAFCGGIIVQILARLARGQVERRLVFWAAAAGALTLGFMPLIWSQALITEVYTLHLLLAAAIIWLLLNWRRSGKGLAWAGLALGIGLTHHLTVVLIGPAALALLWSGRKRLRWRSALAGIGLFLVGLLPYAYLPWAARRMPPVNWENPQTWENFEKLVLAVRYRHNVLEPSLSEMWMRVGGWFSGLSPLFFWPLLALVLLGLLWLLWRDPPAGIMTALFALLTAAYAVSYGTSDYWVNLLPVLMMVGVWLGLGIWLALRWLERQWSRRWHGAPLVGAALALALPLALLVFQWGQMDVHRDHEAQDLVTQVLNDTSPDALVFARGDGQIFALWYTCYVHQERPDLAPILPTFLRSIWYRDTLAANHEGLDLRPDGLGEEALATMVERHIGQRPIYLTWEAEELGNRYSLVQAGLLWQVRLRAAGELP